MTKNNVVSFPEAACSVLLGHRLSPGGLPMEIKHVHPEYQTVQERLDRLQELKKACMAKLKPACVGGKSA